MDLETLKSMKRHELQQEAKRIGIKANQASSVLIDLIRKHYEVGKRDHLKDRQEERWMPEMSSRAPLCTRAPAKRGRTTRNRR